MKHSCESMTSETRAGFSLIEVVLAIGIFLVTVLALVGLLGPTLESVDNVEKTDEVASIVNTLNAFLQSSPDIAPTSSRFDAVYNAVANNGYATVLLFRQYSPDDPDGPIELKVGFLQEDSVDGRATIVDDDVRVGSDVLAAGTVFRAVLTVSSVTPSVHVDDAGQGQYPRYTITGGRAPIGTPGTVFYDEGYFAMEVRIFAEDPTLNFAVDELPDGSPATPANLANLEPIFTYDTAIVRSF